MGQQPVNYGQPQGQQNIAQGHPVYSVPGQNGVYTHVQNLQPQGVPVPHPGQGHGRAQSGHPVVTQNYVPQQQRAQPGSHQSAGQQHVSSHQSQQHVSNTMSTSAHSGININPQPSAGQGQAQAPNR